MGYETVPDEFYADIDKWLSWYKGKVSSFHRYNQYNGKKLIARERATASFAKKVCEDWANLILNERVDINIGKLKVKKDVLKVLDKNNFRVFANRLAEITFALGTGAFVEYKDGDEIKIDYISADMIYPLSWSNGQILECAFASEKIIDKKKVIYVNMHILENDRYKIVNKMFEKSKEIPLPEGVSEVVYTNSKRPFFQIITPNIINNVDFKNPMGISVFANSIDILKGIDLIYDSYQNEFRLGKKRIIVPVGMAQMMSDSTGLTPVFDDNDTEFYAIKANDSLTEIKEINMTLRSQEHETALNRNLNLLSSKCGLGNARYEITKTGIKTATEVISEKSELYENLKKHQLVMEKAICNLVYAIAYLLGYDDDFEVSINFDDSVIEDTSSISSRMLDEYKNGVIDDVEYFMKVYNLTEDMAIEKSKKIAKRKAAKEAMEKEIFQKSENFKNDAAGIN